MLFVFKGLDIRSQPLSLMLDRNNFPVMTTVRLNIAYITYRKSNWLQGKRQVFRVCLFIAAYSLQVCLSAFLPSDFRMLNAVE